MEGPSHEASVAAAALAAPTDDAEAGARYPSQAKTTTAKSGAVQLPGFAGGIVEASDRTRQFLMPAETPNLLCNWSPLNDSKMALVLNVCEEVWGSDPDAAATSSFCDLGCGDGRVVLQVCKAFPYSRGLGVDLNSELIKLASGTAKQRGLDDKCEFKVGDLAAVDLSRTSFVFLNLPPPALSLLLKKIFPKSGMRPGTVILSSDGPLLGGGKLLETLGLRRSHMDREGLYGYLWRGKDTFGKEVPRSLSPLGKCLSSHIMRFSIDARRDAKQVKSREAADRGREKKSTLDVGPSVPEDSVHEKVVQCLKGVYKQVCGGETCGFGHDYTEENLDTGNLQYGEVTYEGMGSLYSAIDLGPDDVFYDLGSGVAKLVLYVALRGKVASSIGIEVGNRRHALAEKACDVLTTELAGQAEEADASAPSCSKYSVVLGDVRKNCYKDVSVAVCTNICMEVTLMNRITDNLMKCASFRRIASIAPMPPHRRLKLVKTVTAACTWAKVSSWHIYDVLEPYAKSVSSLAKEGATPRGAKVPRIRPSASLSSLPASLQEAVAELDAEAAEKLGPPHVAIINEAIKASSSKMAQRLRSMVQDGKDVAADTANSRSTNATKPRARGYPDPKIIKMRCVATQGAFYRPQPNNIDDLGSDERQGIKCGELVQALERKGDWIRNANGWLPVVAEGGKKVLERIGPGGVGHGKPCIPTFGAKRTSQSKGATRVPAEPAEEDTAQKRKNDDEEAPEECWSQRDAADSCSAEVPEAPDQPLRMPKDWHERAAMMFRCIVPNGAVYRASPKMSDVNVIARESGEDKVVEYGVVITAFERRGEWVKTPCGWVQLAVDGKRQFERLTDSARTVVDTSRSRSTVASVGPMAAQG